MILVTGEIKRKEEILRSCASFLLSENINQKRANANPTEDSTKKGGRKKDKKCKTKKPGRGGKRES